MARRTSSEIFGSLTSHVSQQAGHPMTAHADDTTFVMRFNCNLHRIARFAVALALTCTSSAQATGYEAKTLEIGAKAPAFDLIGTDGKHHRLYDFGDKPVLVFIFTTNHCPD